MKKIFSILVLAFIAVLCSCQTTYDCGMSNQIVYDETGHWHPCAIPLCNEKYLYEEHDFGEWVILTQAIEFVPGVREHTCKTCGYKETLNY